MLRKEATLNKGIPIKCPRAGGQSTRLEPGGKHLKAHRCKVSVSGKHYLWGGGNDLERRAIPWRPGNEGKEKYITELEDTTDQHTHPNRKRKGPLVF